jgi:1-acyl-sn-glycerol-3-phosphate acyltransferase
MNSALRLLFFLLVVRPVVFIALGLNVRHRRRLPSSGPAIVVANHNSHLDTFVLMSLFPLKVLAQVHPVGARDYFFRNRWIAWFSRHLVGIIPLDRQIKSAKEHPLRPIAEALERGEIVIVFPEGSRGEPERLAEFKTGIAHLAERHPEIPIFPIYLHGLGKALPRGEALLVPFFCDVFIGEPIQWPGDRQAFMQKLAANMTALAGEGNFSPWE